MLLKLYVVHCLLSRCSAFLLQAWLHSELSPLIFCWPYLYGDKLDVIMRETGLGWVQSDGNREGMKRKRCPKWRGYATKHNPVPVPSRDKMGGLRHLAYNMGMMEAETLMTQMSWHPVGFWAFSWMPWYGKRPNPLRWCFCCTCTARSKNRRLCCIAILWLPMAANRGFNILH